MDNPSTFEEIEAAVAVNPANAQLRYLFGAELAQRREYSRAVIEFSTALQLAPTLHTARLQLGLLQLSLGQAEQASLTFVPLESAPAEDFFLTLFGRGLSALAQDDLPQCRRWLQQGIEVNTTNQALNNDMLLIIRDIDQRTAPTAVSNPPTPATEANPSAARQSEIRTDFSKYGGGSPTRN
jgi:tetratricopeptide (TPR) repeat protein